MNDKKTALFLVVFILLSAALFFVNNSRENEKKIRAEKEFILSKTTGDLAEKNKELDTIVKEKSDLENQLMSKKAELESALKSNEDNSKSFSEKIETLIQENGSLEKTIVSKESAISELSLQIKNLEAQKTSLETEKSNLAESLKKFQDENKSFGGSDARGSADSKEELGPYGTHKTFYPEMNSVNLGTIIMQKTSKQAAQVEQINKLYGFIVISAGAKEGLHKESVINIVRGGKKLIGKAVVEQLRDHVSTAIVLPEWSQDEIETGDLVTRF